MAELSNHSYHYDRNLLVSLPSFEPPMDLFDSLLPDNDTDLLPSPKEEELMEEEEEITKEKKTKDKKKPRRKRRNLTGVSKQRRAANERERKRLQIINGAFKDLKAILPLFPNENNISKIEIVRLAARTIKYLSEIANKNQEDMNNIDNSRSPSGSEASDQSEGSSISTDSSYPEYKDEGKLIDTKDIDISNLLFNCDDLNSIVNDSSSTTMPKKEERSAYSASSQYSSNSSNHSDCASSSSDGFSGFDINIFLNDSDSDDKDNDVFPSMLSFW